MMNIQISFLASEQIKKFARDNCLTQSEMDLFSKLVDKFEIE